MIVFSCQQCQASLSAEESQVGELVQCPACSSTLNVPEPEQPIAPPPPLISTALFPPSPGRRYGFNCIYCSSRLEANEAMAAQPGQCPTCGSEITIPILDPYGRLIDPKTRQVIKQDPHPVHAYAAAGNRAPAIERLADGHQVIRCSRCSTQSPITANNCKFCGMPFTMEGTTLDATSTANGFCVASLVLGIIGIPAGCTVILPALAIVFGIVGLAQVTRAGPEARGKGLAIAGILCGAVGGAIAVLIHLA